MSTYPGSLDNGATDTEYTPLPDRRVSAQQQQFDSVNEAIGTLQYNLEQHIAQCADGLAPLADFIASSWAVLDEYEARLAKLEDAARPMMDENGVWVSHDAWDAMERELAELRAKDADAEMLQRMVVSLHKTGSESVETIVRLSSDLRGLRAELAAAQAEAARYKALWESVPWEALQDCAQYVDNDDDPERIEMWAHNALALARQWLTANAPKEAGK